MDKDDHGHQGGCCKGGSKEHSTQETLDGEHMQVSQQCEEHCRCISDEIQCVQSSTSREASGLLLGMGRRTGSDTSSQGFFVLPLSAHPFNPRLSTTYLAVTL